MSSWIITSKPSFHDEYLLLSEQDRQQVLASIKLLQDDPRPYEKTSKMQRPELQGRLHTIRTKNKNYRLYYTFEHPFIHLLTLRQVVTAVDETELKHLDEEDTREQTIDWNVLLGEYMRALHTLSFPITTELLRRLRVPEHYYARLLTVRTREALLNCRGVPRDILERIDRVLFKKPLAQIAEQPDYVTEVEDLERYKDGTLLSFLLLLAPEQSDAAKRALNAGGPTQVKGKPGTGKSTVALYRIKFLLEQLAQRGQPRPRILFTTYTNALVESSKCLLEQVLGEDAAWVEVCTADSLVATLLGEYPRFADDHTLIWLIKQALEVVIPEEERRQRFLNKLSYDYLKDELCQIILARQIGSLEVYLPLKRGGRQVPLLEKDRTIIWRVYEHVLPRLKEMRKETWQQIRLRAEAKLGMHVAAPPQYDAVVVDEAQDLEPSVLRILVRLCKETNRFFITADANQTIYRSGFTWKDVDASLNFQGRTRELRTNYRSTREIGEAAHSYLTTGAEDSEAGGSWIHISHGPRPAVRWTQSEEEEWQLLGTFVSNASQDMGLGLGACAILCPSKYTGETIVRALKAQQIEARFFASNHFDLTSSEVKVLTLHSSKGLEFPIVALSGFRGSRYDQSYDDISEGERAEILIKARRLLFVGMTRAMQTLLVLVPAETPSPVLTGFDAVYWDGGQRSKTT